MSSFLTPIVRALSQALAPLEISFSSKSELEAFLFRYGWDFEVDSGNLNAINSAFAVTPFFDVLFENLDELNNGNNKDRFIATIEVLEATKNLVSHLTSLAPGGMGSLPAPFNQENFWSELSEALFPDLLAAYLRNNQRSIYCLLHMTGTIRYERVLPAASGRVNYTRTVIDWDQLGTFLVRPYDAINDHYSWNKSGEAFRYEEFLRTIENCMLALGVPASVGPPRQELADSLLHNDSIIIDGMNEIEIPIVDGVSPNDSSYWKIGILMIPISDPIKTHAPPSGLGLSPILQGELSVRQYFSRDVYLQLKGAFDTDNNITLKLYPDSLDIDNDLASTVIEANMELIGAPEEPWLLLGDREGSRLELEGFHIAYGIRGQINDLESIFRIGTTSPESSVPKKLRLAIELSSEGDGFVNSITGGDDINAEFSGALTWSSKHGFTFEGSAGLELAIPLHLDLGPIELNTLYISFGVSNVGGDDVVKGDFGVGIVANLGPLVAVVENIGVRVKIIPVKTPGQSGAIGNADFDFSFKPPTGVGFSLDVGAVKGGGYLYFDPDRDEYAGALELVLSDWIAVKAVGLVTTKMPDGSKGFSLLIIITAEFGTGYQLGWGFTLLGVGGILGLNRIVNIVPLKEGVRSGAIESVMFPQDFIANAPRIISDLRQFFPPQKDIFLVGPMAKIGWGTPPIMKAQLGVILEFPSINITILGVVKVVLPDEEADVLRLQVNFIGRIEPSNKLLWFYGELFESRVLFITLEGGFGLLLNWGDKANFVLTAGGFHPEYSPPPLPFPEPPRISVSLLNSSNARIMSKVYFAVTSNSVQFGSRDEVFFGSSEFKIEGHFGYDALFQFNPFYFRFSLSIDLSVKVFGVGLFSVGFSGLLEGPTPWHIQGKGKIGSWLFSLDVPFEHIWGDKQDTKLDPIEVFPLIESEFLALNNWETKVPESNNLLVSLRKLGEAETDKLVLHPVGKLRISQRKIPINFQLDKVGNQRLSDVNWLDVDASLPGIGESLSVSKVEDKFAIGQFKDLDGSRKLSSPGFQPLVSGIEIGVAGEQMKTSRAVQRVIRYETIIIDNNFKRHVKPFWGFLVAGYAVLNNFLFSHFLKGNAVSKSTLSKHHKKRMQPFNEIIRIVPNQFSVVYKTDNRPMDAEATTFTSQAKALAYLERQIQNDAVLARHLHVIPNTELNIAA